MRILFSSLGTHGHTYPLIPLAIAARAQGDEVVFATDKAFTDALAPYDVEVVQAGADLRSAFALALGGDATELRPTEVDMEVILRMFGSTLPRRFAADLEPVLADFQPDLVVHEVGNPGAAFAAERAGISRLCHGFGRAWVPTEQNDDLGRHLRETAADLGVSFDEAHPMVAGSPYVDIAPPSFQIKEFLASGVEIVPLRPTPFAERGEVPDWVVAHERPLVYLTLGTAFGDIGVLRTAIAGLAALDVRVLVATGPTVDVAALGEVPDNVELSAWVPQADLLPHTDLVVHHGGSGTTIGAFAAGRPQLVLPQGADQFANAEAVVEGGLGDQLLGDALTAEAITAAARRLLADQAVRAAASAIQGEVEAMPAPAEVARRLPEFVR
ncbi:glycosyltransferase [Saccharothrix violaceirubra]|uniref:UDP:flavonoid glycosyltransferase YjiC (YdhE family) n=1 Tax=Saccharothrix violaceirubra TaxID=413306 RepID=A0A7W7WVT1_9PSEU|nr:nucleotide disphospho-sugar-binding domain-containing protein [Saccharothrix violaceirubra]MBB4964848.1 UDP:flavonoid glycosyltransferase YjiC (YdhE family) [Saccharothrix violaceirubra]